MLRLLSTSLMLLGCFLLAPVNAQTVTVKGKTYFTNNSEITTEETSNGTTIVQNKLYGIVIPDNATSPFYMASSVCHITLIWQDDKLVGSHNYCVVTDKDGDVCLNYNNLPDESMKAESTLLSGSGKYGKLHGKGTVQTVGNPKQGWVSSWTYTYEM